MSNKLITLTLLGIGALLFTGCILGSKPLNLGDKDYFIPGDRNTLSLSHDLNEDQEACVNNAIEAESLFNKYIDDLETVKFTSTDENDLYYDLFIETGGTLDIIKRVYKCSVFNPSMPISLEIRDFEGEELELGVVNLDNSDSTVDRLVNYIYYRTPLSCYKSRIEDFERYYIDVKKTGGEIIYKYTCIKRIGGDYGVSDSEETYETNFTIDKKRGVLTMQFTKETKSVGEPHSLDW